MADMKRRWRLWAKKGLAAGKSEFLSNNLFKERQIQNSTWANNSKTIVIEQNEGNRSNEQG
jgi:hypothetical protein